MFLDEEVSAQMTEMATQGQALSASAKRDVKVLVVGNPANTNALIAAASADGVPAERFTALTRLDENRARAQVAQTLSVPVDEVQQVTIWGNHSSTQYPDLFHAVVKGEVAINKVERDWYETSYIPTVQQRGAAIIAARGASSAASAANAAICHIRDWALGTADGDWVSMGVYSDGSYGIEEGLIYSFPCTCTNGQWSIVQGLDIDAFSRARMTATEKELQEERDAVKSLLPA